MISFLVPSIYEGTQCRAQSNNLFGNTLKTRPAKSRYLNMIGILFSSTEEAQPFLAAYERGRFDGLGEGESFHDDDLLVTILGIGKIKGALRTERLLRGHKLKQLVHVGTCTALNDTLKIGEVVSVAQVFEGDRIELSAPTYPRMPLATSFEKQEQVTLVTQDHTVQGATELSYWQRIADISDMSGYAVAYVAATHGVPCKIAKVISGHMGIEDKNFRKTLSAAHNTMSSFLVKNLNTLTTD